MQLVGKLSNRKLITLSIIAVAIAACVYFVLDPAVNRFFPPCLFYKLTGWQCPGCGTQRALHSLLHLNFAQAFFYNPILIPTLLLVGILIYLEHFGGKKRFPNLHRKLTGRYFILAIVAIIIIYWVGRNIV